MKLLKFGAEWCNPCKVQKQELEKNPLSIEVEEFDAEENEDLCVKYKVRNLPTLLLLEGEELIHKWVGFTKSTVIQEVIDNYASKLCKTESESTDSKKSAS